MKSTKQESSSKGLRTVSGNCTTAWETNSKLNGALVYRGSTIWLLGLVVAVLRPDLLKATGGISLSSAFHWGVVASGTLVGLGSNPTHEVIRSLQEYEGSKKA